MRRKHAAAIRNFMHCTLKTQTGEFFKQSCKLFYMPFKPEIVSIQKSNVVDNCYS